MAKRVSRRELKETIKNLKLEVQNEKFKAGELKDEYDRLNKRFEEMGSQIETFETRGSCIETIEIKPEAWGTYVSFANREWSIEARQEAQSMLISKIAKGLMEANLVQIIEKMGDLFPFQSTIGAKLYVVPWEKLAKRAIKLSCRR